MGDFQSLRDLLRHGQRFADGNRTAAKPFRQRRALDHLQYQRVVDEDSSNPKIAAILVWFNAART